MYELTEEQLQEIKKLRRFLENLKDLFQDVCKSERSDIYYGFTLGQIHAHVQEEIYDINSLIDKIQETEDEK